MGLLVECEAECVVGTSGEMNRIMRSHRLLVFVVTLGVLGGRPVAAQTCKPLTGPVNQEITSYVEGRYNLPKTTNLRITQVTPVSSTCYRKITLESAPGGGSAIFYLTPDEKFLTRSLMDLSEDPRAALLSSERDTMKSLLAGSPPSRGPATAPVTIVEFGNFECPYCARFSTEMNNLPWNQARNIRLVFLQKLFPRFAWGSEAAMITSCTFSQSQDAFWKMHDFTYAQQGSFTDANVQPRLMQFAKDKLGINPESITGCMARHGYDETLEHDRQLAVHFDVMRTPTLFINGRRYVGMPTVEVLENWVDPSASQERPQFGRTPANQKQPK